MSKARPARVEREDPVQDLPAGEFSAWLHRTRNALLAGSATEVPCGDCTACCRSFQFVHIGPEETAALARIPAELLFPAPGHSEGAVLLGYDERGHCPMLEGDRCSIYDDRPATCRSYDCRVFPAAGVAVVDEQQAAIAERAKRWSFAHPSSRDRAEHAAVEAAAGFVTERGELLPSKLAPRNATELAVLAVEVYEVFLDRGAKGTAEAATDLELAGALREASEPFGRRSDD
jgi:Fe-S-cluster containining protein